MSSSEAPVAIVGKPEQPERVKTQLDPEGLIDVCEKLTQSVNRIHINKAQAEAQLLYEKARKKALVHRLQVAKWNKSNAEAGVLDNPFSHEKHLEYADALENLAVVEGNVLRNEAGLLNARRTWLVAATAASLVDLPWAVAAGCMADAHGIPEAPDAHVDHEVDAEPAFDEDEVVDAPASVASAE
jgi:hypothetical protein